MNKLINYFKEARQELAKVAWPSKQTTLQHTGIVIVLSIVMAVFLGGIDYLLTKILQLFV
jgi:preprotein translocase subunit SecE